MPSAYTVAVPIADLTVTPGSLLTPNSPSTRVYIRLKVAVRVLPLPATLISAESFAPRPVMMTVEPTVSVANSMSPSSPIIGIVTVSFSPPSAVVPGLTVAELLAKLSVLVPAKLEKLKFTTLPAGLRLKEMSIRALSPIMYLLIHCSVVTCCVSPALSR